MELTPDSSKRLFDAYSALGEQIKAGGYETRVESDFDKIRGEIEALEKPLTPFFWTNYYDFNGQNGFCMILEKKGKGLAYLCMQRFELGTRTLEQAYIQRLKAIYSHDPVAKLDESWSCWPLQEIRGVIAYAGDAVTHKDLRLTNKSREYLALISRQALVLTMSLWQDVGHIVGTVRQEDRKRGLDWVYGAATCIEMVERWETLPAERKANYAICLSSRAQIQWLAETVLANSRLAQQEQTGTVYELDDLSRKPAIRTAE